MLIVISGKRKSGKTTLARALARRLGRDVVEMSSAVRRLAERAGAKELASFALRLRSECGKDVVAREVWSEIQHAPERFIVAGLRSVEELNFFRDRTPVFCIFVDAERPLAPETRADVSEKNAEILERVVGTEKLRELADLVVQPTHSPEVLAERIACTIGEIRGKVAKN